MFGDKIKELRKQKGISQQQLAEQLNFAQSTVGMWESNKREPSDMQTIKTLADFFCVSTDYLLGDKNNGGVYITNSKIANGANNHATITIYNGGVHQYEISEMETELIKICRKLNTKEKTKLLSLAYELESKEED